MAIAPPPPTPHPPPLAFVQNNHFSWNTRHMEISRCNMDFLSKACGERALGNSEAGSGLLSGAQLWWLYGRASDCVQRYLLYRHSCCVARANTTEAHGASNDNSAPDDLWHLEELLLDPNKRAERLLFEGDSGRKVQLVPGVVVDDEGFMPLHLATVLCSHFFEHPSVLQALPPVGPRCTPCTTLLQSNLNPFADPTCWMC